MRCDMHSANPVESATIIPCRWALEKKAAEMARPEVFDLGTRDLNFFPFFTSRIASSLLLPTPQIYLLPPQHLGADPYSSSPLLN